ncbi:MAG TPA: hypothetical protein VKM00_00535 [Luteimonas sp.]|nr:hypothetical protein [Luteimonas sp.]
MPLSSCKPVLVFSLFTALILGGTACTGASVPVAREPHAPPLPATAPFGSTILRVGKSVTFTDGLTIELKDINDSRCPAKVQCIWAGELTANLVAHGGDLGGQAQSFSLGALTAKNRVVASYDFVLADASPTTATVIVTKPGVASNAAGIKSGIHGVVTVGPSCPVERTPPDPNCADRPQAATFSIDTPAGAHVAEVSSGADGEFTQLLPAGTYVISLRGTAAMPSMAAQTFEVSGNKYTELSLKLDSGIR